MTTEKNEKLPGPIQVAMREDGWLIERNGVHLCYSSDGSSCYRWVTFTDPAAWRFETKEAAERVIRERGLTDCRAEGHTWMDGPRSVPLNAT